VQATDLTLRLLTREGCGLCRRAEDLLRDLGLAYEPVDIDREPALLSLYTEAIPVVLAGDRELCRAPITREGLLSALRAFNLKSSV
jgi:glutaredoxin